MLALYQLVQSPPRFGREERSDRLPEIIADWVFRGQARGIAPPLAFAAPLPLSGTSVNVLREPGLPGAGANGGTMQ